MWRSSQFRLIPPFRGARTGCMSAGSKTGLSHQLCQKGRASGLKNPIKAPTAISGCMMSAAWNVNSTWTDGNGGVDLSQRLSADASFFFRPSMHEAFVLVDVDPADIQALGLIALCRILRVAHGHNHSW